MTLTKYFDGELPREISNEDLENANNGISRRTIPWSEVKDVYSSGPMQQLKQQQHVGHQINKPSENESDLASPEL